MSHTVGVCSSSTFTSGATAAWWANVSFFSSVAPCSTAAFGWSWIGTFPMHWMGGRVGFPGEEDCSRVGRGASYGDASPCCWSPCMSRAFLWCFSPPPPLPRPSFSLKRLGATLPLPLPLLSPATEPTACVDAGGWARVVVLLLRQIGVCIGTAFSSAGEQTRRV